MVFFRDFFMFHCVRPLLKCFYTCRKYLFAVVLIIVSHPLAAADSVDLTILATADLHGRKMQIRNAVDPAVRKQFKLAPDRTIYVDCGDCTQGSLELLQSRGSGILQELYRANCTIFVPGNHELEYGFDAFKKLVREFPGTVLAANLHAPELKEDFQDSIIVEKAGVKIAFIGLMLKNMEHAFPVDERRFRTLPGNAVLRRAVNKVKLQGADIIVLLRHAGKYGGGENTYNLIKNVPEIDLVIGAHTHKADAGSVVGRAWFVQPPSHGKALGLIKISFDCKSRRIKQITSSMIQLEQYPEISMKSGKIVTGFYGKTPDYPAEVIRRKLNADLVLYSVSNKPELLKLLNDQAPRLEDFYRVFPYFDPIITVVVSSGEFRTILCEYAKFAHKRKQYLSKSGFSADIVRGKVRTVDHERKKQFYTLAISAYAAAGAGGNLPETGRILKNRIDHRQAENASGILEVLCK